MNLSNEMSTVSKKRDCTSNSVIVILNLYMWRCAQLLSSFLYYLNKKNTCAKFITGQLGRKISKLISSTNEPILNSMGEMYNFHTKFHNFKSVLLSAINMCTGNSMELSTRPKNVEKINSIPELVHAANLKSTSPYQTYVAIQCTVEYLVF